MEVGVHIDVGLCHVAFDQHLVLLAVSAGDDQVIFRADEPVELLKPVGLAGLADVGRDGHVAQRGLGLFLGRLNCP